MAVSLHTTRSHIYSLYFILIAVFTSLTFFAKPVFDLFRYVVLNFMLVWYFTFCPYAVNYSDLIFGMRRDFFCFMAF